MHGESYVPAQISFPEQILPCNYVFEKKKIPLKEEVSDIVCVMWNGSWAKHGVELPILLWKEGAQAEEIIHSKVIQLHYIKNIAKSNTILTVFQNCIHCAQIRGPFSVQITLSYSAQLIIILRRSEGSSSW